MIEARKEKRGTETKPSKSEQKSTKNVTTERQIQSFSSWKFSNWLNGLRNKRETLTLLERRVSFSLSLTFAVFLTLSGPVRETLFCFSVKAEPWLQKQEFNETTNKLIVLQLNHDSIKMNLAPLYCFWNESWSKTNLIWKESVLAVTFVVPSYCFHCCFLVYFILRSLLSHTKDSIHSLLIWISARLVSLFLFQLILLFLSWMLQKANIVKHSWNKFHVRCLTDYHCTGFFPAFCIKFSFLPCLCLFVFQIFVSCCFLLLPLFVSSISEPLVFLFFSRLPSSLHFSPSLSSHMSELSFLPLSSFFSPFRLTHCPITPIISLLMLLISFSSAPLASWLSQTTSSFQSSSQSRLTLVSLLSRFFSACSHWRILFLSPCFSFLLFLCFTVSRSCVISSCSRDTLTLLPACFFWVCLYLSVFWEPSFWENLCGFLFSCFPLSFSVSLFLYCLSFFHSFAALEGRRLFFLLARSSFRNWQTEEAMHVVYKHATEKEEIVTGHHLDHRTWSAIEEEKHNMQHKKQENQIKW